MAALQEDGEVSEKMKSAKQAGAETFSKSPGEFINIRDLPTVVGAMIDNVSYNGTNGATVL